MFNFNLHEMALMLPAIILGLTFHEYAHGKVADLLGDHTARNLGRLTLNPISHIDPVGFIMLIIAKFGWAKPIPVNPYNLRGDKRQAMLLVSLAGPATNIILAVISAVVLGAIYNLHLPYANEMISYMIVINVILGIFNLIPIPPLDGSKILAGLLPGRQDWLYSLEAYGAILLILLVFSGAIGFIFRIFAQPLINQLLLLANSVAHLIR